MAGAGRDMLWLRNLAKVRMQRVLSIATNAVVHDDASLDEHIFRQLARSSPFASDTLRLWEPGPKEKRWKN